jgi:hypothetical protein
VQSPGEIGRASADEQDVHFEGLAIVPHRFYGSKIPIIPLSPVWYNSMKLELVGPS